MKKYVFLLLLLLLLTACAQETENTDTEKELPPLGNEEPDDANLKEESTSSENQEQNLPPLGNEEPDDANLKEESTSSENQEQLPALEESTTGENGEDIYSHAIYLGHSTNGDTWTKDTTAIADHASMPELLYLKNNPSFDSETLLLYFVDATVQETGAEELAVSTSLDQGKTWSEREIMSIEDSEDLIPVDPSVIEMQDASLRLYYFDFSTGLTALQNPNQDFTMYTALSTDGKTFTENEPAFTYNRYITDPEVVEFNGVWYMYFLDTESTNIGIAKSSDAIHFTYLKTLDIPGVPGAQVVDEEVYLYGCALGASSGITLSTSSDGESFSEPEVIIQEPGICAAAGTQIKDESFLLAINQN